MMTTLRVLILEGHQGVRDALEQRLRRVPGIQVVAAVGELEAAVRCSAQEIPDVALCDPRSIAGIPSDTVRRLRRACRAVVVLTTSILGADASDFLTAGAAVVLLKGCTVHAIQAALVAAALDRSVVQIAG